MKNILTLAMTLTLSIGAIAMGSGAPQVATASDIAAAELLINRHVIKSKELAVFAQLTDYVSEVKFDATKGAEKITLRGMVTVGGDMACSDISLQITQKLVMNPGNRFFPGYYTYSSKLILDHKMPDYCSEYVTEVMDGLAFQKAKITGIELKSLQPAVNHLMSAKYFEDKNIESFAHAINGIREIKVVATDKKLQLQMRGLEVHGDIAIGDVQYTLVGKTYRGQGLFGPQDFWKYQSAFKKLYK